MYDISYVHLSTVARDRSYLTVDALDPPKRSGSVAPLAVTLVSSTAA